MMDGMSGMMWGAGLLRLLLVIVLVLGAAALVKILMVRPAEMMPAARLLAKLFRVIERGLTPTGARECGSG